MSPRSGSDKRKRTIIVTMRISPEEAVAIRQIARKRGESVSGLMRSALLHNRPRLSRIEVQALAQLRTALGSLTGAVNKVGGNVNQAVYRLNLDPGNTAAVRLGQAIEGRLHELKNMFDRDMGELRIVILQALGKEPRREKYSSDED